MECKLSQIVQDLQVAVDKMNKIKKSHLKYCKYRWHFRSAQFMAENAMLHIQSCIEFLEKDKELLEE